LEFETEEVNLPQVASPPETLAKRFLYNNTSPSSTLRSSPSSTPKRRVEFRGPANTISVDTSKQMPTFSPSNFTREKSLVGQKMKLKDINVQSLPQESSDALVSFLGSPTDCMTPTYDYSTSGTYEVSEINSSPHEQHQMLKHQSPWSAYYDKLAPEQISAIYIMKGEKAMEAMDFALKKKIAA